jgi:hypothetical protein
VYTTHSQLTTYQSVFLIVFLFLLIVSSHLFLFICFFSSATAYLFFASSYPLITFTSNHFSPIILQHRHVGVYWRGGALVNRVTEPGFHFKLPFIDQFENVQVTLQTYLFFLSFFLFFFLFFFFDC